MTTKDYITKSLSKFEVSGDDIDLILVENGLIGESDVNVKESKTAICNSVCVWFPLFSSVSEGGVSKSVSFESSKLYYQSLCKELGISDVTQPKLTDRSYMW